MTTGITSKVQVRAHAGGFPQYTRHVRARVTAISRGSARMRPQLMLCRKEPRRMTAPDEDPAIASLLDEAARLAPAGNEKLGEALAIAEQTRRSMPISNGSSPGRTAPFAPASTWRRRSHASGVLAVGWVADPSCFIYAIAGAAAPGPGALFVCRRSGRRRCGAGRQSRLREGRGREREPGGADRRGKEIVRRLKADYRALGACLKEEKLSGDSRGPFLRHRKCP
jgi:hypothetical protein